MPARFDFPQGLDIWLPIALDVQQERHGEMWTLMDVVGRLKPDVTIETAQSELTAIAGRLPAEGPTEGSETRITVLVSTALEVCWWSPSSLSHSFCWPAPV